MRRMRRLTVYVQDVETDAGMAVGYGDAQPVFCSYPMTSGSIKALWRMLRSIAGIYQDVEVTVVKP